VFDVHAHLQDPALADDLDGVLLRAAASGVQSIVVNGTSPRDWDAVAGLAAASPCLLPAYGVHPWFLDGLQEAWLDDLARRLANDPAASVGEIGLDRAIEPRDDAAQERIFLAQLRLAREMRRPVTLHCRRVWGRMLDLLRAEGAHPAGLVLHSYGGGEDLIRPLVALNGFFSFSGSVTHPANRRARAAARAVPSDRLLVETDSPDLPPFGVVGKAGRPPVNEPSRLPMIVAALADLRGEPPAAIAAATQANAIRIFGGPAG